MLLRYLAAASAAGLVVLASLPAFGEPKLTLTVPGYSWEEDDLRAGEMTVNVPTFEGALSITAITADIDGHKTVCQTGQKDKKQWSDNTLECDLSNEVRSISWKVGTAIGNIRLEAVPITTHFGLEPDCASMGTPSYVSQEQLDHKTIRSCYLDGKRPPLAKLPAKITFDPKMPGKASIDMAPDNLGVRGSTWRPDEKQPLRTPSTWTAYYYPVPAEMPTKRIAVVATTIGAGAKVVDKMCFQLPLGWGGQLDVTNFELQAYPSKVLKPNTDVAWDFSDEDGIRKYCAVPVGSRLDGLYQELKQTLFQGNSVQVWLTYKGTRVQEYVLADGTVKSFIDGSLMHQGRTVERVVRDRPLMKWVDKLCLTPKSRPGDGPISVDVSRLFIGYETQVRVITFKEKVVTFYPREKGSDEYCAALATGSDAGAGSLEVQSSVEGVRKSLYLFWDNAKLEEGELARLDNPYFFGPQGAASEAYISAGVYTPIRGTAGAPEAAYWLRGNVPLLGGVWAIQDVFQGSIDLGLAPGLLGAGAEDGTVAGVSASAYGAFCLRFETTLTPGTCATASGDAMGLNTPTGLTGAVQASYGFFVSGSLK